MSEASWGDYVRHADYDALATECERLRGDLEMAMKVPSVAAMHSYLDAECAKQNIELAAERDAALAELAALKCGREAIGRIGASHGYKERFPIWNTPDGSEPPVGTKLYTAPPAQASAWVPEGLQVVMQQRDHYAARVADLELVLLRIADDYQPSTDAEAPLALGEMREAIRGLVLAAAPTPGASDGKGGE